MSIKRRVGGAFDPVDTYEHMKDLGKLCIRMLNDQQNVYESELSQLAQQLDEARTAAEKAAGRPASQEDSFSRIQYEQRIQELERQLQAAMAAPQGQQAGSPDRQLQAQYEQRIEELEQRLQKYAEQSKYLDNAVGILKEARRSRDDMLQKAQDEADRQVLNAQSLARKQIQRLSEEVNLLECRKQTLLDDVTSIELALKQVRGSSAEARSQRVDADILERSNDSDSESFFKTSPFRAHA